MKTRRITSPVFFFTALIAAGVTFPTLQAGEAKPVERTPLKLNIDRKPINRDAAERVSYAPIVKKTAASVVFVYSSKKVRAQDQSPFFNDPMFRRFFDIPDSRGGRPAPEQKPQAGLGSGVIITSDGYILTNNHVVDGADDVKVSIGESNRRYDAKVIGRDSFADIAVIKIEATGLSPATFGDSEQLQAGDVVLAIGAPFGLGQSVSRGIVSALGRVPGIERLEDFIQTDAAINPGNSGGALLDTDGRLVGINTAILSGSGGFNGVGFAIPINLARSVAEQIVNTGHVERGFLGIAPQDLDEDLIGMFKVERGALASEVSADSPAEKAGLKPGDVITKIDGTEIRSGRHLSVFVSQLAPGKKVPVEYVREGKTNTATVELGHRPEDSTGRGDTPGAKDEGVLNGVGVDDLTPQLRDQFNIPSSVKGAIITSVDPDSPSATQGLREGDVILDLDGKPAHNASEAVKLSEEIKGPKVAVRVFRNGHPRFYVIDESKK